MLSCHLAYFIALADALVSWVPLIQLCMPQWRATCSAQLFIVTRLSGCSISIIKEQASVSLDLVPVSQRRASPSEYHGQDRAFAQKSTILMIINRHQHSLASSFKSSKMSCFIYLRSYLSVSKLLCFSPYVGWKVMLSTQQNSEDYVALVSTKRPSPLTQPGQSVSLAMVASQYLCPFSPFRCGCDELRPKRGTVCKVKRVEKIF